MWRRVPSGDRRETMLRQRQSQGGPHTSSWGFLSELGWQKGCTDKSADGGDLSRNREVAKVQRKMKTGRGGEENEEHALDKVGDLVSTQAWTARKCLWMLRCDPGVWAAFITQCVSTLPGCHTVQPGQSKPDWRMHETLLCRTFIHSLFSTVACGREFPWPQGF